MGAVQMLNDGSLQVPDEFCIVYSASQLLFYLLYKLDCKDTAQAAVQRAEQEASMPQLPRPSSLEDETAQEAGLPSPELSQMRQQRNPEELRFFEEECKFYETLISAVFPYFETDMLSREQALLLFRQAGL